MTEAGGHPPSLRTRVLLHAVAILEDGKWHDREDVIEKCMLLVPPAVAERENEKARVHHFQNGAEKKPRKFKRNGVDVVRSGARSLVQKALRQDCIKVNRRNPKKHRIKLTRIPRAVISYGLPDLTEYSEEEDA